MTTAHERFLKTMHFEAADREPLLEWGAVSETVERWMGESGGSREEVTAWRDECDAQVVPAVDCGMRPAFEEQVLREDAESRLHVDRLGTTLEEKKDGGGYLMPGYVGFPVRTRDDWEQVKKRFDPDQPDRYPDDWDAQVSRWGEERPIVRFYGYVTNYFAVPSLFAFVRMLLGPERALYAFYDEPDLVHDMMETATEFAVGVMRRALAEAPLTLVQFFEDMCYRSGPLISPAMFREFMLPRYKRITGAIREAGIDVVFVDSDGALAELIPLWLEGGVNGVQPLEQAAGNDLAAYRKEFGQDLLMAGGIDKRVLAQDRAAIDRELARVRPLMEQGGYIPTLDHGVPPDVPYDNFQYYWDQKKRLLGI